MIISMVQILIKIFFTFLASLFFLFGIWNRLKEDYPAEKIFTLGFYTLLGIALGSILADNFFPSWWFWLSLLGAFVASVFGITRFKMRFFETIEALVYGLIILLLLVSLYQLIVFEASIWTYSFLFLAVMILIFHLLDRSYKKFSWYRSGRVGFTGMAILGLFFLSRSLLVLTLPNVVSFVGRIDAVLSAAISFFSFLAIFNLSRT